MPRLDSDLTIESEIAMVDEQFSEHQFERRLQSVLQAIMLAILIGVGYTMIDLVKSSTRQEMTNAQVAKDISELRSQMETLKGTSIATALAATNAASAVALAASNAASAAAAAALRKK